MSMTRWEISGRHYDEGVTPGDAVASYNVPGYLRPAGRGLLSFTFQLNWNASVYRITQLNS